MSAAGTIECIGTVESMVESVSVTSLSPLTTPEVTPNAEPTPPYERCKCLRCGYKWGARDPWLRPPSCARCGSHAWDQAPQRSTARKPTDPPNPNWKLREKPPKKKCPVCGKKWRGETVAEQRAKMDLDQKTESAMIPPREMPAIKNLDIPPVKFTAPPGSYSFKTGLGLTPPPGMRDSLPSLPPPPSLRSKTLDSPEVIASRGATRLSDELKSVASTANSDSGGDKS